MKREGVSSDPVTTVAREAVRLGLSVVPVSEDGSKAPAIPWKQFQSECATEQQVRTWFSKVRAGVALITGSVSRGLEAFEFDDYSVYEAFKVRAAEVDLGHLVQGIEDGYCEASPGGGIHWLYYCPDLVDPNIRLAVRGRVDGSTAAKVLIETRGEGGLIIIAPSGGGVHPSGKPYVLRSGSLRQIVTLSGDEKESLWDLARSFDERTVRLDTSGLTNATSSTQAGNRPGDIFIRTKSWGDVLQPHGWRRVSEQDGESYWLRPGKQSGVSATTNVGGSDLLYVFSTSTVFEAGRGYNKFSAYAILNHSGDFAAAAQQIALDLGLPARDATDLANADRFVQDHAHRLRYVNVSKEWMVWNG